jgi:UDP-3-O-[3-hydroxymyristoyl] glucosamine N-acyltransferase
MKKSFSLAELSALTHSKLIGDPDHIIIGVADLDTATKEEASFLGNPRYLSSMKSSQAGVIFVDQKTQTHPNSNFLVCENPTLSFQIVVEAFFSEESKETTGFHDIHLTAIIHPTAKVGSDVIIGPYVVIDKDAVIGNHTIIHAHCSIGLGVTIGSQCLLHPHVVIREHCKLGNNVIIQPGAVIGSCGFGYTMDKMGRHIKIKHFGKVEIEDDVEIGANATVDRARFQKTLIKKGTKIDNLVQIAHNVTLGEHNIIVAQSGIAGSTETGHHVMVGGQSAIDGHLNISSGTMIAAKSGVTKSIKKPGKYGGIPALPINEYNRNSVYQRNIEDNIKEIKALKSRIESLERDIKDCKDTK